MDISSISSLSVEDLAFAVCRGGWPASVTMSKEVALDTSLCTCDLRIYSDVNGANVFHYHDKYNLEADIIISLRDGRWAAIEVKLGQKQIEEAARNLLKLKEKINTDKMGEPSFLMVMTGGEYAYKRSDGVLIVPIGCLKD